MRETHVAQTFFFCQAICLLLGYSWLCEALLYDHIFFSLKKKKNVVHETEKRLTSQCLIHLERCGASKQNLRRKKQVGRSKRSTSSPCNLS